ncbi:MAG: hypothetical protein WAO55_12785 [Candidatus Manganitrophaceae bacterium]
MKINGATSTYLSPLLLVVWFFIWGICPWNNTSSIAQASEEHHSSHHHSETTDTHHASKGAEHSCSGSISYTKSDLGSAHFLSQSGSIEATVAIFDRPVRLNCPPYFFNSTFLPRLLTDYYQLYSVYRI